ncbi:MAG: DUF3048 domain-containing protein [bacterium]
MADIDLNDNPDEQEVVTDTDQIKEIATEQPIKDKTESFDLENNSALEIKKFHTSIKEKITNFFNNPKKRLIFIISLSVIIVLLFATGIYFLTHEKSPAPIKSISEENLNTNITTTPKDVLYNAPLDGVQVNEELFARHPLGVMIENHPDARPQSGLDKASIIYEAMVEGGITRFMAVYGTYEADKVGPVRSARPYYVDWIHGYAGYYAHVGGSTQALSKITAENIYDLNQFAFPAAYWREQNGNVALEHTMYASTPKLRVSAADNQYPKINSFKVYSFKDEPTEAEKATIPEEQKISINYGNPTYNVYFKYDKSTNSYKRFEAQAPHIDRVTKVQLSPKNVIAMTVEKKSIEVKAGTDGWQMTTVGTNKATFFMDGKVTTGTWKKDSAADREIFYDSAGKEIQFNRGQTWICVISPDVTPIVE